MKIVKLIKKTLPVLAGSVIILALAGTARAYVLDGDLSDWGVNPFFDWVPDSATVDYTVENNFNRSGSDTFEERYDLEAMYFDNDSDYLYFSIVSSVPYRRSWTREDLGISLDGDWDFEYGATIANFGPFGLNSNKKVYSVTDWDYYDGVPYNINSGTILGTYDLYNRFAGNIEPGVDVDRAYILEGRIDRLLFGDDLTCGSSVNLLFSKVTCLKDWITVSGDVDGPCNVIPEPSTILLFGTSIIGLAGARLRKKKAA